MSRRRTACAWLLSMALAGCAGSSAGTAGTALSFGDPWVRPTPSTADAAAIYLTIDNRADVDDALIGASSDRCAEAEIHRTSVEDGTMSMAEAPPEDLVVVAGGSIVLEPGGLHVMCQGLTEPLEEGDTINLDLVFERAGRQQLSIPVEQR